MASPRMLAQRQALSGLAPHPVYLNRPQTPRHARPGEFAELTARAARSERQRRSAGRAGLRLANEKARGFERTIPTSGPGRRRAKAQRNNDAVHATETAAGRVRVATLEEYLGDA